MAVIESIITINFITICLMTRGKEWIKPIMMQ